MKKYYIKFYMSNGNVYSFFVKSVYDDNALLKAHQKLLNIECCKSSIKEIVIRYM